MASIKLDVNNLLSARVGSHGLNPAVFESAKTQAAVIVKDVQAHRAEGWTRWMDLPYNQDAVVKQINALVKSKREQIDDFIMIGIGGSSLGMIALQTALNAPHWNSLSIQERNGLPRFWVIDNIDPARIETVISMVDWSKTMVNVITKSGSTAETMGQFYIIYNKMVSALGVEGARKRVIATTDLEKGTLRKMCDTEGFERFVVPDGVGGRFSVLCAVGLIPAAFLGMDIKKLLKGAADMDSRCKQTDIYKNPALLNAVSLVEFMKAGKNIHVMMPYSDALKSVGEWYAQLWAESLGKKVDKTGKVVNVGQTPVYALGATDQHSQVQLYSEGPYDKVFTFLAVGKRESDIAFPIGKITPGVDAEYFQGKTLGELFDAEFLGTKIALTDAGRPNETITLDVINEETIGGLFYLLEMQTAYAGALMGIDAYDQPGVEAGKERAFALLGRKGFEKMKAQIEAAPKAEGKYVV